MKLKNVKVGQTVKVKNTASTFVHKYIGARGTVVYVEDATYDGDLSVQVRFPSGYTNWGNHKDIKLIKV